MFPSWTALWMRFHHIPFWGRPWLFFLFARLAVWRCYFSSVLVAVAQVTAALLAILLLASSVQMSKYWVIPQRQVPTQVQLHLLPVICLAQQFSNHHVQAAHSIQLWLITLLHLSRYLKIIAKATRVFNAAVQALCKSIITSQWLPPVCILMAPLRLIFSPKSR